MGLTAEIKEKIVLALTGTTREQALCHFAVDEKRCALGVIAEALGFEFEERVRCGAEECSGMTYGLPNEAEFVALLGDDQLRVAIINANDRERRSFDEIAKMVKEWPVVEESGDEVV
jgi:hypothetical protein